MREKASPIINCTYGVCERKDLQVWYACTKCSATECIAHGGIDDLHVCPSPGLPSFVDVAVDRAWELNGERR